MKTFFKKTWLFLFLLTAFGASAQVPALSSYPASQNVVFLDFDGHVVEGTYWNGSGAIVCDSATLNAAQITGIFNRIAEDYRPFTINITTDSTKYWAAPPAHRVRVVLTTSSSWYGAAGGVAFINSFTWGDNTPCFVFTALLGNNTKYIAEAASHEIGHTLGLRHQSLYDAQCNKLSEYHYGFGGGEIGWAPIMGVGYYRNMTLWHYGSNPFGCDDLQDDLSILLGNGNGIAYRTDDHGSTTATATAVPLTANNFLVQGIIEKPGDTDVVKFSSTLPGRLILDASPYSISTGNTGSDVDLQVELLNDTGTVVGVYNNPTVLNAFIDTLLAAGTYYLRVQGMGNLFAPNYASLGAYTLNAAFTPGYTLPLRKLQLKGTTESGQHKLDWQIDADEKVVRQTMEVASDATDFKELSSIAAAVKSYYYSPSANSILYYRLKVFLDDGKQYYSNTVALRNNSSKGKPSVVAGRSNGTLTVSSPSVGKYAVIDMAGRILASGTLTQGLTIIAPSFSSAGVYLIRFENSEGQWAEKFSKQ